MTDRGRKKLRYGTAKTDDESGECDEKKKVEGEKKANLRPLHILGDLRRILGKTGMFPVHVMIEFLLELVGLDI